MSDIVNIFPPQLATMILAALPVTELRGAIPIALGVYHLDIASTYFFAVVGSMVPVVFIIWLLGPVSGYLMERSALARRFFVWLFSRTRHHLSGNYERWGVIALVLFTATPLPLFGAWSGAVAAFIFGIPKKQSLIFISLGTAIAGLLVTAMTLGALKLF